MASFGSFNAGPNSLRRPSVSRFALARLSLVAGTGVFSSLERLEVNSSIEAMISLADAAKLLGYSPPGLRKVVELSRDLPPDDRRAIRFFQTGPHGRLLFRPSWLEEFVNKNSANGRSVAREGQRPPAFAPKSVDAHGLYPAFLN